MTCSTLASSAAESSYRRWCLLILMCECVCVQLAQVAFQIHIYSPWVYSLRLSQPSHAALNKEYLQWLLQPLIRPEANHRCPCGVISNFPLLIQSCSAPTPAVRGECASRFQGAWCCGSPRRPCAAGPVQTPGVDQCPSASSGSPATPPVWRKQA